MFRLKTSLKTLMMIQIGCFCVAVCAQTNSAYYSANINEAIKAQKRKFRPIPKTTKLPKLNVKQLSSIRIKGAIGATAANSEAVVSKQEISKLEQAKANEKALTNKNGKQTPTLQPLNDQNLVIKAIPSIRQGSYRSAGYKGSYYNIQGEAQISASKLD